MHRKLSISIDAMERAVKARLLRRHGLSFAPAYQRIPIRRTEAARQDPNWTIVLDDLPPDSHAPLREAASYLGRSLRLD